MSSTSFQDLSIDPLSRIGLYAIQNGSASRFQLLNHNCYKAIETASQHIIGIIKAQCICDNMPISVEFNVAQLLCSQLLKETNPSSPFLQLLNKVYATYRQCGAEITPEHLPITERDFYELERQCDAKGRDDSLKEVWKEVKRQFGLTTSLQTSGEISNWLNDASNQSIINNVRDLNLKKRGLQFIPDEIRHFPNLQVLHLNDNKITKVPVRIGELTQLSILFLHKNEISHFPAEIGGLQGLRKLSLYDNKTDKIPQEISKLTNLRTLHLNDSQVNQIPDTTRSRWSQGFLDVETDFARELSEEERED